MWALNHVSCDTWGHMCIKKLSKSVLTLIYYQYIYNISLGRSYEAGTCTIVISVKRAFKCYLFCYRLDFDQKS